MTTKERFKYNKSLQTMVGRRISILDDYSYMKELIMVYLGTTRGCVELFHIPDNERMPGEDNRIDFSYGDDISGSIWYLETNNPLQIYITEVCID